VAWDEFCRLYQPLVRAYVGRFHLQDSDADDLAQDVFAKLHGHMARFDLDHARGKFRGGCVIHRQPGARLAPGEGPGEKS